MTQLTVLVTGATAGFGQAIAKRYLAEGHQVVAAGRRQDRLEALKASLPADQQARLHTTILDVTDKDAVFALPAQLPAAFANVNVLVNNAGLALGLEPAHRVALDDWERMVDTNIKGLMYMTRAFLPGMVERGRGHVFNLGSIAGRYPYPGGNVYSWWRFQSKSSSGGIYSTPNSAMSMYSGSFDTSNYTLSTTQLPSYYNNSGTLWPNTNSVYVDGTGTGIFTTYSSSDGRNSEILRDQVLNFTLATHFYVNTLLPYYPFG